MGIQEDYGKQAAPAGEQETYAERNAKAVDAAEGDALAPDVHDPHGVSVAGRVFAPRVAPVTHSQDLNGDLFRHQYDPDVGLWFTETNGSRVYHKDIDSIPADITAPRNQDQKSKDFHNAAAEPLDLDAPAAHPGALQPGVPQKTAQGTAGDAANNPENTQPAKMTYDNVKTIKQVRDSGADLPKDGNGDVMLSDDVTHGTEFSNEETKPDPSLTGENSVDGAPVDSQNQGN